MTPESSKPRFKRRRLSALISLTLLINACSTLPPPAEDTEQAGPLSTQTRSVAQTRNRAQQIRTQRETQPELELTQAEIEFQNSVWFRVSEGMQFYHQHYNDSIQEEIDWFLSNRSFISEISARAAPFIYEIVSEVQQRNLPTELALLPFIESAFEPSARSPVNAAGLWQFMAPTAASLGLQRDWWYDGRHDPIASTSAALDYLQRLHALFNEDWLLTLAAYNAGQGTVSRAIERNERNGRGTDFWSLSLPGETQRHVPRLLALAYLMADPLSNELALEPVPDTTWLARVDAGSQIDLNLAAQLAGIEPELLYQLNPGYLQWATRPQGPHLINLPLDAAERFSANLADLGDNRVTWERYQIKPGDTLSGIARSQRTTVAALQQANNLTGSSIRAGDDLLIPRAYGAGDGIPGMASILAANNNQPIPAGNYIVKSGDSLWSIANRYSLTVNELRRWNSLSESAVLQPGQRLVLQAGNLTAAADLSGSTQATLTQRYEVKSGDTLAGIARRHGVSVEDITEWNGISQRALIHPGQELILHVE
ncbi:MAG: LysM peptidoglycan-binding domain-containing protein [Pseudomonadota bacterium]|nr:LysM peptidoglycan-binding domain-containing protein [Pseudomonadota bacterium]